MTKTNNEFMQNILTEEAWKNLSEDFEWNEALLEKYQNDVDWEEISSNSKIRWTVPMVQKFAKKLNWTKFSESVENFATSANIEMFKDYWDWHELSENTGVRFTDELLDKFAERWDWCEIINSRRYNDPVFDGRAMEFYNKFKEHIPSCKLQNSVLWDMMVDEMKDNLISQIIS